MAASGPSSSRWRAEVRRAKYLLPALFTLPILCSCLNSIYSWDPGCLGEQYGFARHGSPRVQVSIGWFPGRYYQYASFRAHDDGFTAFSRYPAESAMYCGRMAADDLGRLGALWKHPTVVSAAQEEPCSGGFAYWAEGRAPACPETVGKFHRHYREAVRGEVDLGPLFRLEWYEPPGFAEPRVFYWDLESPLPPVIEDAVAETVKIVCAESKIFQRRFHRHLPELAETFGC